MIVYLMTAVLAFTLSVGILLLAASFAAKRPNTLHRPQNAPQGEIQPHRGDYSALDAGSIEGECTHG